MKNNEKLNYVEFAAGNLTKTKQFFELCFGWTFQDHGPEYTSFANQGLDGGFFKSDKCSLSKHGAALLVFYSEDLEATLTRVLASGGVIMQEIFSFPGGRRFHFAEPSGNEFAVWSDK